MERRQLMQAAGAGVAGIVGGQVLGLGDVAGASPDRGAHNPPFGGATLVSLSHVNDPAVTNVFPGDPAFTLTTVATIPEDGFYMQYVQEAEHTGTHWGAPAHFQEGGLTADQLDPNDLLLPAVKIDIRDKVVGNDDYALTIADLKAWERVYGRIPHGAAVILWTGWESRWGTDAYPNLDADGVIHQPGFSPESVQWLIDKQKLDVRGSLGTDTFGADLGIDPDFTASTLLFDQHRISLENLNNLGSLPPTGAWVLVGGPIHKAGSGSTATIYAILP
ncbi:MAG TPA: cyclase family protein [Acidimicrobiales bacterium]